MYFLDPFNLCVNSMSNVKPILTKLNEKRAIERAKKLQQFLHQLKSLPYHWLSASVCEQALISFLNQFKGHAFLIDVESRATCDQTVLKVFDHSRSHFGLPLNHYTLHPVFLTLEVQSSTQALENLEELGFVFLADEHTPLNEQQALCQTKAIEYIKRWPQDTVCDFFYLFVLIVETLIQHLEAKGSLALYTQVTKSGTQVTHGPVLTFLFVTQTDMVQVEYTHNVVFSNHLQVHKLLEKLNS